MSAEFWAIIGVAVLGLGWRAYESLRRDINGLHAGLDGVKDRIGNVEQRLARIEGWIAGRFREEAAQS